jgi:hypothetical protein
MRTEGTRCPEIGAQSPEKSPKYFTSCSCRHCAWDGEVAGSNPAFLRGTIWGMKRVTPDILPICGFLRAEQARDDYRHRSGSI